MCVVIVVIKVTATHLVSYFHAESAKVNLKSTANAINTVIIYAIRVYVNQSTPYTVCSALNSENKALLKDGRHFSKVGGTVILAPQTKKSGA